MTKKCRQTHIPTVITLLLYLGTSLFSAPPIFSAQEASASPFEIPENLGHIEEFSSQIPLDLEVSSPLIVHIQSAHGNYEAEKNTQAILRHLHRQYGFDLLFLEGGAGKLQPELFNLFPKNPELNIKVADTLAKKAEISGPELFLIENMSQDKTIEAYGIEDPGAYRENRKLFQQVLREKGKTDSFLETINSDVKRLAASSNPDLRDFLKTFEAFEVKKIDLISFLRVLKKQSQRHLDINFGDPFYQKDWPALTKFYRLEQIESFLNHAKIQEEKEKFLQEIKSFHLPFVLLEQLQTILNAPKGVRRQVFEELFEILPVHFSFKPYAYLKLYLQFLILKNELKEEKLFEEIERLKNELTRNLAKTEAEKKLIALFRDYWFFKKMFSLELSRQDYETIRNRKVMLSEAKHLGSEILQSALSFYRGAYAREDSMQRNVFAMMQARQRQKAILVTGGFHVDGMKEYFKSKGYSYLLISPRINEFPKVDSYRLAMLEAHKRPFKTSHIANILWSVLSRETIDQLGGNQRYWRSQVIRAFRSAAIPPSLFAAANLRLRGTRSELRTHLIDDVLIEIQRKVQLDGKSAGEVNLTYVLERLKLAQGRKEQGRILTTLVYLLEANPALRQSEIYKATAREIKKGLVNHFGFVKTILKETPKSSLTDLVKLRIKLFSPGGEKEMEAPSTNLAQTARWAVKNRTWHGVELLRVYLDYDTGMLPSQLERGKFISLYLYLKHTVLSPLLYIQKPITPEMAQEGGYSNFFERHEDDVHKGLSYSFRLSSGVEETEDTLEKKNLKRHLIKSFREIRFLNLGLFLASAEDSSRFFFPEERPFWIDEQMEALALAYRAFERRFVSYLREFDPLRDPEHIYQLEWESDSLDRYYQRQIAFLSYHFEEILYPYHSWLYPNTISAFNDLIPLFRNFEGLFLQQFPTIEFRDQTLTIGYDFIQRLNDEIRDPFLLGVRKILLGKSIDTARLPLTFLQAFRGAQEFSDPFIDSVKEEATQYYIQTLKEALSRKAISFAQLFDSSRLKEENVPQRSELRKTVLSKGVLYTAEKVMDKYLERDAPSFPLIFNRIFRGRIKQGVKLSLPHDQSFAVVTMPVPKEVSKRDLIKVLREFRPFFANHPRKVLVLTYAEKFPEYLREQIYKRFDRRVLIFQGNHQGILKGLYESAGNLVDWSDADRRWVTERFIPRANELNRMSTGTIARPSVLGSHSLVVASEKDFNGLAIPVMKQFIQKPLEGFNAVDLLRAYLLFGVPYASMTNAELLKKNIPEFQFDQMASPESFVRFSFNSEQTGNIQNSIRIARRLLVAA